MTIDPPRDAGAPIAPIGRQVLAVELADRLRAMILEGTLGPGEKVPERALTERFAVSRTPLREAMKVLASEGLIDLVPNRGALIARQTDEELREVFPILAALEGLAGELAAPRIGDADIERIDTLTEALRQSFDRADLPAYFAINQQIHAAILDASGNDSLRRSHALLAHRIQRARYQANLTRDRWARAVVEHNQIAAAVRARDPELLGARLKMHMLNTLRARSRQADGQQADQTEKGNIP